ncbi:MAG: hypothetical protein ACOYKE_02410, partial [Ferruginibacter sp.]
MTLLFSAHFLNANCQNIPALVRAKRVEATQYFKLSTVQVSQIVPSGSLSLSDNQKLVTKKYVDDRVALGSRTIVANNGLINIPNNSVMVDEIGIRSSFYGSGSQLFWDSAKSAFRVGYWPNTTSLGTVGQFSFAQGEFSKATGYCSVALGNSTSYGAFSFAGGNGLANAEGSSALSNGSAQGLFSTSIGYGSSSIGSYSIAMGYSSYANGNNSMAIGDQVTSTSTSSISIGTFNDVTDAPNGTVNDRLFQLGNGKSSVNRSNAITVLKNGKVGIGSLIPDSILHIVGGLKFVTGRQGAGKVLTSDANGGADWVTPSSVTYADSIAAHNLRIGAVTMSNALKLNISDTANVRARLVAGANITLSGTFPNITIAASGGGGGSGWGLTGTSGTNSGANYIGTSDLAALRFRVNGQIAGFLDSSGITRNTSFGLTAMNNETVRGIGNTAIGYGAMAGVRVADSNNVFIGAGAGFSSSSFGLHRSYNVAIGTSALLGVASNGFALFSRNIAIGQHALRNTGSTGNIAIGVSAGRGLNGTQIGNQDSMNIAIGDSSMATPYSGLATSWSNSNSIAIGKNALMDKSGNRNIAIGNYTSSLADGIFQNPTDNVSIGHSATPNNSTGSFNVFIGSSAGQTQSTGHYNVAIGYGTECATGTGTGQLSIQNIIYGNGN